MFSASTTPNRKLPRPQRLFFTLLSESSECTYRNLPTCKVVERQTSESWDAGHEARRLPAGLDCYPGRKTALGLDEEEETIHSSTKQPTRHCNASLEGATLPRVTRTHGEGLPASRSLAGDLRQNV
jgi:hypothetical protein